MTSLSIPMIGFISRSGWRSICRLCARTILDDVVGCGVSCRCDRGCNRAVGGTCLKAFGRTQTAQDWRRSKLFVMSGRMVPPA